MNFFDSDSDLNVFLGRILVLLNELSLTKKEEKLLNIERIVIYDFLLKYPTVLSKVLRKLNKKNLIDIKEGEINTLDSFYPAYRELYRFDNVKYVIQILYSQKLLDVTKEENGDMFLSISNTGKLLASGFSSVYFNRVKEISKAIVPLHTTGFSSLRDSINSLLHE